MKDLSLRNHFDSGNEIIKRSILPYENTKYFIANKFADEDRERNIRLKFTFLRIYIRTFLEFHVLIWWLSSTACDGSTLDV